MKSSGATIKDIAKLAGVSISTVSRALHNHPKISEETKERVKLASEKLNYTPNYSAQNLVKRHSNMIGVVLPVREEVQNVGNNPFFMQIIQGITQSALNNQQLISLVCGRNDEELIENIKALYQSGNIERFIFLYAKNNDPVLRYVVHENFKVVVVGQLKTKIPQVNFVDNDNLEAGYDATKLLIHKGENALAFVYTSFGEQVQIQRYDGYQKAMKEAKKEAISLLLPRHADKEESEQLLKAFLDRYPNIQGFVAYDDMVALRLQTLLAELGKDKTTTIVSFNNTILAQMGHFTSVDVFPYQLGNEAVHLLLQQEDSQIVIVPHQIVDRDMSHL